MKTTFYNQEQEIYTHLSRFREEESINALDKHLKDQGIEKASKARAVV